MSLLDTASLIVTPNGYKEGKLYSVIPSDGSGDLSVTRATTATRVNSQGLVELVPYNLVQYSEDFANGYWTNFQSSETSNNTTAPNGTLTADKLTQTGVGGGSIYATGLPLTGIMTLSCYFKAGSIDEVIMDSAGTSAYWGVKFNLTTQAITYFGVGANATITSVGNGWYRCSVSANVTGTNYVAFGLLGAVNDYVYLWGAQLNEGTIKPYQKTETRLNIPRLDYSNGTCPSILVEPQRTNILTYSSSLDNAAYTKAQYGTGTISVTANYGTAPDGTLTADRVQMTQGNFASELFQRPSTTAGQTYTVSFWAKSLSGTPTLYTLFDNGYQNPVTFSSEWVRYEYTYTAVFNASGFNLITWGILSGTSSSADILVWGVQHELGSYATSYIPTTSASVTRNADVISKTGISSLIGQTEGTIFIDFVLKNPLSATNRIISITESVWNTGGSIRLDIDYNQIKADFVNGGSNIGSIIYSTTPLQNTRYKVAIAYKENDCKMYINGVDAGSDTTTAAMPTCSELYLNALGGGFNAPYEASNINAAALWTTRLTNTQLAQLTTI